MPINFNINSFKCFNQIRNSEDFSTNTSDFTSALVGNIGEKVRLVYELELTWWALASFSDEWLIIQDTAATGRIIRGTGSFRNDGFRAGDIFDFHAVWADRYTVSPEFNADINTLSTDGKEISFTLNSGTFSTTGANAECGIWADADDTSIAPDAAILKFGLVAGNEPTSFVSKISDQEVSYYLAGIDGTNKEMIWQGTDLSGQTGSASIQRSGTDSANNAVQFTVTHDLIITPYYIVGFLSDLQNGTTPALFQNNVSLSYVFRLEMRNGLASLNTAKVIEYDQRNGVTGWFNENFNGFNADYSLVSISYEDSSAEAAYGVIVSDTTTITITIEKDSGSFLAGQKFGAYFSYLPDQESEYQQTATDFESNFIYDAIFAAEGASNTGSNIFDSASATIDGSGNLVIELETSFSSAQQIRLDADKYFAIWVQLEESGGTAANSDRVAVLCDANNFQAAQFIQGLTTFNKFNIITHPESIAAGGTDGEVIAWDEDGIIVDFELALESAQNALLTSLTFELVAYKDEDTFFTLDTYQYDISGAVIVSGVQQLNIDTSRGYQLRAGDEFNFVKLYNNGTDGTLNLYEGQFAQKITWQEWIRNLNADPQFFDGSEENDGLNQQSSNYARGLIDGYEIKIRCIATTSGIDANGVTGVGQDVQVSASLDVFNYNQGVDGWSVIQTLRDALSDTQIFTSSQLLMSNKDTLYRTVFSRAAGVSLAGVWAVHRLEVQDAAGNNQIIELSTERDAIDNQILQGDANSLRLDIAEDSGDIVAESIIKSSLIDSEKNYKLSCRLGTKPLYAVWDAQEASLTDSGLGQYTLTGALYQSNLITKIAPETGSTVTLDIDFGNGSILNLGFDYSSNIADIGAETPTSFSITLTRNDATTVSNFDWADIQSYVEGSIIDGDVIFRINKIDWHTNGNASLFGQNAVAINCELSIDTLLASSTIDNATFEVVTQYDANELIATADAPSGGISLGMWHSGANQAQAMDWGDGTYEYVYRTVVSPVYSFSTTLGGGSTTRVYGSVDTISNLAYASQGLTTFAVEDLGAGLISINAAGNSITSFVMPASTSTRIKNILVNSNALASVDFSAAYSWAGQSSSLIDLRNNTLSTSEVNQFLIDVEANAVNPAPSSCTISCQSQTPSAPPSGAGATAKAALQSYGYTVNTD